MRFAFYFLMLVFCSLPSFANVQQDTLATESVIKNDRQTGLQPVQFDQNQLEKYKNDPAFDYQTAKQEPNWWEQFKQWFGHLIDRIWHWLFGDYKAGSLVATIIQVLPYILIGLLIGLIVWLFIRLNPSDGLFGKKNKNGVLISEEEKIIREEDIPELINQALADGNYRLAVRYSYLLILKELQDRKIISYEFAKTNRDYSEEIKSAPLNEQFKSVTYLYDFIWYGDFHVTEADYSIVAREFDKMEAQLKLGRDE